MIEEYIRLLVDGVMDSFEEFFDAISVPSAKFTFHAFLVSLIFLPISILCEVFQVLTFVSWQESITCSLILLCVTLVDATTRGEIKKNTQKFRDSAQVQAARFREAEEKFLSSTKEFIETKQQELKMQQQQVASEGTEPVYDEAYREQYFSQYGIYPEDYEKFYGSNGTNTNY